MEREITIENLLKHKMIGWICNDAKYDKGINRRCYVYPEYVLSDEGQWLEISKDLFPESGAIEVVMSRTDDSSDFIDKLGNIVEINLNAAPQENNNDAAQNRFITQYNSKYGNNSNIDIRSINTAGLIQILKCEDSIDLEKIGMEIYNYAKLCANNICLLADDGVYGSFTYNTHGEMLQLKASEKTEYQVGKFSKEKVLKNIIEVRDNHDISRVQFVPMESIQISEADYVKDWMDDDKLMMILGKLFKDSEKNNFTRNNINIIKQSLLENQQAKKIGLTEERKRRVEKMLSNFSDNEELFDNIVERAISDENILEKIINKLVLNYYSLIEPKVMSHLEIEKKKKEIYDEIKKLEAEKEKLRASNEEKLAQSKAQYEDQLCEIKGEIVEMENQKAQLSEKLNILEDIQNLNNEKERLIANNNKLKNEYSQQVIRNDERRREGDQIEEHLKKAVKTFKEDTHMVEELINKELLNKIYNIVNDVGNNNTRTNVTDIEVLNDFTADKIISNLMRYINDVENRKMTKNDIINLLICLSQGFITTFAGEPGTGKTSLSSIIGKALGLKNNNANRMVEISVERGWTSYKDYIGYYNPLTHSLEKSNVEVFDSMQELTYENKEKDYPFMIYLLDEANLSQIEYYWSVFLRLCDASGAEKSINLGGDNVWKLPYHMKFIATVNFDHTTEELSPRFLDRSWIVMLQPENFEISTIEDNEIYKKIVPYSYKKVFEYFGNDNDFKINEACAAKWEDLQRVCKNYNRPIMPRSIKMVEDYMKVASVYMDLDSAETRLAPLDFAFSQKILPTLNGNIEELVDELIQEVESAKMPLCEGHLKRMKDDAEENMGYFQFFSHRIGG